MRSYLVVDREAAASALTTRRLRCGRQLGAVIHGTWSSAR
jgi:hypothetical protein